MLRPPNDSIGLTVYSLRVVGSSVLTDYLLDLGCEDGNEIIICVLTIVHCARGCNVRTSSVKMAGLSCKASPGCRIPANHRVGQGASLDVQLLAPRMKVGQWSTYMVGHAAGL